MRRRRFDAFALGALLLALALPAASGCGPSAEKQEAVQILAEIDRMRDAEPEPRLPLLEALETKAAKGELAERARKSCTSAYRALHDANFKLDETRAKLAEARKNKQPDTQLLQKLLEGTRLLQKAQKDMETCKLAVGELHAFASRK